ncbi:disease resistance protein RPV1-like [Eucalyptus grandis]|uniref:disease resistance protein RPV1-like n=1 Tax=Eucalyptus grandis TaxID=71139 RepID=UPI00192E982F|nr:disease resistance protein RPV1-like [Eucalyptus grandis]
MVSQVQPSASICLQANGQLTRLFRLNFVKFAQFAKFEKFDIGSDPLFERYTLAFEDAQGLSSEEFEDLTHEVVSITGGLPLSLEVFGSLLCGKRKRSGKGTDNIEAINLSDRSSEYLNEICGLDGDDQDGGTYEGKQFENLRNLRFLDMTKTHLIGDFKNSMTRLKWLDWKKCPASFEAKNFHVVELVTLGLDESEINEKWKGWSFFKMAEGLKYLNLYSCTLLEDTDFLSAFKKLEVLILNGCKGLKRIDASIGDMEALIRLELYDCESLTELPAEIGNLKALQQLGLIATSSLSALPDRIDRLENLEILEISYSGIEELPNGIGRLRKLRELDASNCNSLRRIMAKRMCNLSSLQRLDFLDSYKLPSLPNFPSGLTYLGITCQSRKLPSLSHLCHLKELRVSECRYVECIQVLPSMPLKNSECSQLTDVEESESPQSLNTPFKLELLDVRKCHSLKTLDVSQFIHLRTLSVSDCGNLLEVRGLDKLICLESLTVKMFCSIEWLDLLNFKGLKTLVAKQCKKLAEIQGLNRLEDLEILRVNQCTSIKRLDLPKSGRLKELKAKACENLAEILSLNRSEFLESLDISECTSIKRLDLPKSGRLKELKAEACENLAEIPSLDRSKFLESLDISKCTSIEGEDHGVETGVFANDGHRELEGGASPLLLAEVVDSLLVIASKREGQVSKMSYMHYCARKLLQFGGFGDSEYL